MKLSRSLIIGLLIVVLVAIVAVIGRTWHGSSDAGQPASTELSADANYQQGIRYLSGDDGTRNVVLAQHFLTQAAEGGFEPAQYTLAKLYWLGDEGLPPDRVQSERLRDELLKKGSTLGAKIAFLQYDVPADYAMDTQKVMMLAVEAASKGQGDAASLILSRKFLGRSLYLSDEDELFWIKKAIPLEDDSETQNDFQEMAAKLTSRLSDESLSRVNAMDDQVEAQHTFDLLKKYADAIGPLEPSDLLNEGWGQFTGERGIVNEPLAQYLMEEALRVAIISKNQYVEDLARNNLGVIFDNSVNPTVRNHRLAQVHLLDAYDSEYGPDNLLIDVYLGQVSLSPTQIKDLRKRYLDDMGIVHITERLPPLSKAIKKDPKKVLALLAAYAKKTKDAQAVDTVLTYIEDNPESFPLSDTVEWYRLYSELSSIPLNQLERYRRVETILAGHYVKDYPKLNEVIPTLFHLGGSGTQLVIQEEQRGQGLPSSASTAGPQEKRALYALVIGNSHYVGSELKNSLNDAVAVSDRLKSLGFDVTLVKDGSRGALVESLMDFSRKAQNADVTVLYYSGHGSQIGGVNYLLPVDIDLRGVSDVAALSGISLNDILIRNIPGNTRLVFLDACRTSPFKQALVRGPSDGLAPVNVPKGTLISFATRDGGVTLDGGSDDHSPYTRALLRHFGDDQDIALVLREVRDEVFNASKGQQEPWEYGALSGGQVILSKLSTIHH